MIREKKRRKKKKKKLIKMEIYYQYLYLSQDI